MLFSHPSKVFKPWIGPDAAEVSQVLPAVTAMNWGSLRCSLRRDAGSVLRCQEGGDFLILGKSGLHCTPPMTVLNAPTFLGEVRGAVVMCTWHEGSTVPQSECPCL